jgi:hydrogenase-4 component F
VILKLLFLLPLATSIVCMVMASPRWLEGLNLVCAALLAGLSVALGNQVLAEGSVSEFGGFFYADALSALVVGLVAFVYLAVSLYSVGFMRQELRDRRVSAEQQQRYYTLTPLFVSTMMLVPLVDSLGVMWVAIEGGTLVSVLLVAFHNQKTSLEAAWKYIIIGSVGIALALFGTVIAYYSAVKILGPNATAGMNWSALMPLADKFDPYAMRLAFILVLVGYGTKAGLAPMHTWKPDAYAEAPLPAAALMGAAFINCAIYAIMRFHALAARCVGPEFTGNLLIWLGVGSILVAAPFILVQRNFRRILAYSSIDHAGIMVAALGFGGSGVVAALLHMVFHAVSKPLMFFCAGNVQQHFNTPHFRKVTGVIRVLPWTGGLFLAATLAVTGTPPFSLFQSEFLALSAALAAGKYWAAGLFIFGVVLIFAGFLAHMTRLNLGRPPANAVRAPECHWKLAGMGLCALPVVLFMVLMPAPLYQLVTTAARLIGGGQ